MGHLLTLLVFAPALGALGLFYFPDREKGATKAAGLTISLAVFAVSLMLIPTFKSEAGYQFVQKEVWIPSIGASYHLGIDGISLFLVLLTTFITPVALLGSFTSIQVRVREFVILVLFLETAMLGALVALDVLLFYFFWEAMLIPMYFLIGIWGYDLRVKAAIKFFIYTLVGSLLMLVAIIWIWQVTGAKSFDLVEWTRVVPGNPMVRKYGLWLFGAFALAFAIKVPMVPFHTWLPLAHVQAPTAGSVVLAGVLLKMGTYGFIRFAMPLFPEAALKFAPGLAMLAVVGVIYGALLSMVQKDIKSLVAYSSISHLGFCMLGLACMDEKAVLGSVYQGLNHGVSTGALFLLVGTLYERRHTREISEYGGIAAKVPLYTIVFLIITLSSIGLPGLNGFIGEFLILMGTFTSDAFAKTYVGANGGVWFATLAASGVILAAIYLLWMVKRVFFGPLRNPANQDIEDLNVRERVLYAPLVALVIVMGVFPGWFLTRMAPSVNQVLSQVRVGAGLSALAALPAPAPDMAQVAPVQAPARVLPQADLDNLGKRLMDARLPPGMPPLPLRPMQGNTPPQHPAPSRAP
ncbi:MAG: NADH-quinone oxidoreductase subunit M [Deltaproteobacteria bacterium]|nr:NADH-quinone oxidoreductase subunit M [Deltaproteobacteria bacterium]